MMKNTMYPCVNIVNQNSMIFLFVCLFVYIPGKRIYLYNKCIID